MPDWKCTRCDAINLEGQRLCEGCGNERKGTGLRGAHVVKAQPLPVTRACTDAQNKAAWRITMDVMEGKCNSEEGKRRLAELFQMPELVNQ